MVLPGRDLLRGEVEVDETFVGGPRAGKRGRGATNKTMVIVAVERHQPRGFGRCRLGVIPNAQSATLKTWLEANIEPGSTLVTDGLLSYGSAAAENYVHEPFNVKASGQPAHIPLPGVHRVASLFKRWLLGTTQGAVDADHLPSFTAAFGAGEEHLSRPRCHVEHTVAGANVPIVDDLAREVGEVARSNRVVGRRRPREDANHGHLRGAHGIQCSVRCSPVGVSRFLISSHES